MQPVHQVKNKPNLFESALYIWALLTVLVLLTGFLTNRVVNNSGLLMASLHVLPFLKDVWKKVHSGFFISILVLVIFPSVWDILFENGHFLYARNTVKWSLVVYPMFFLSCMKYPRFLERTVWIFMGFMAFSSTYSLVEYFTSFEEVNAAYGKAKVMKVLAYSDHIRLSWATGISMILAFWLLLKEKSKQLKWVLILFICFQFVYLHVLGSKTGLISIYLSAIILLIGLFKNMSRIKAGLLGLVLILSPVAAYKWVPSFYKRVSFILYDYSHYVQGDYKAGLSDAIRISSIRGGFDLWGEKLWFGHGFNQLHIKMKEWYLVNAPEIDAMYHFVPISELLIYGASGGILGTVVLLIFAGFGMYYFRRNIFGLAFFIPLLFSLLYENHLETQLGVFVFGFSLGIFYTMEWQRKNKKSDRNEL